MYKVQVKHTEGEQRGWVDVRPFGGTIRFGSESDAKAFLADWHARRQKDTGLRLEHLRIVFVE